MLTHGGYDFTVILHLCALCLSLLIGSYLRSKIKFLRKYLIPAPMIGGIFLLLFYNYVAPKIPGLVNGPEFLGELMFHLLNVSFISMQLRVPEKKTKPQRKGIMRQNLCALLGEYGMQTTFGLLTAGILLKKYLPGAARTIGLCLPLGFELGPGQAESMAKVWEGAPYFVQNASEVALAMAAIGFLVGSIVGVILINTGAKKGWISEKYIEKLRNRKIGSGFFKDDKDRIPTSFQTTVSESMDTFSLHIGLVFLVYLISYLFMAGLEFIVAKYVGGKILEAVQGLWGINFVVCSLVAILVRKIIIARHAEHIIDNHTCNRIEGVSVDLTVAACLGAIEIEAVKGYIVPIIVLTVVGMIITCVITPWICSRLFADYPFMRFLMIFGTANGTLPTALSLVRVVDPDFETPVAQDYANSTGLMFVFALPIIALANWVAQGKYWIFVGLASLYIVASVILYFVEAGKKAFAKPGQYFYVEDKKN